MAGTAFVGVADGKAAVPAYERQLDENPRWALSEGSRHFEERSAVFEALHKITRSLQEMGIPYAVVGGMALFQHGLRRFTEDVDILVKSEDLRKIHDRLKGRGYLPPHQNSKNLRDTEVGVCIKFLVTEGCPGDGKEKPVVFPDPASVSFTSDGINYIDLSTLIELELASGMSSPHRGKDLVDVQELIRLLNLPLDFSDQLNPYVRDQYAELWQKSRVRYIKAWRMEDEVDLKELEREGVTLEHGTGADAGQTKLVTTNPEVAEKYGMVEEFEYWDETKLDMHWHVFPNYPPRRFLKRKADGSCINSAPDD